MILKVILPVLFIVITGWQSELLAQERKIGVLVSINNPINDVKRFSFFSKDTKQWFDAQVTEHRSFSMGLAGIYRLEKSFLRLRFQYSKINRTDRLSRNWFFNMDEFIELSSRQQKFSLAPGFFFSTNEKKGNFYAGIELPLNYHGKYQMIRTSTLINPTNGLLRNKRNESAIPNDYSAGIGAVFGFEILVRPFSIMMEFSPVVLYAFPIENNDSGSFDKPMSVLRMNDQPLHGYFFLQHNFSLGLSYWF